ncbi:MAG: TlpA family protein disulfide reductase [Bacteroidales bacterium]|nr:TlpA family protein disulfide reductase [Bacteroidales bacterium]
MFDHIAASDELTPVQRNLLLYFAADDIAGEMPVADKELYLAKFLQLTGDTAKYRYIAERHGLDFSATDLNLLAISGGHLTLDTLLAQHRGQLVYIDFWASWCAPCRRAMPDAATLRAEYTGRDVAFVYLSLDEHEADWRGVLPQLQLSGGDCHNYLVTNPKTARMLEDMRIPPIPRYMLYGRDGQVLHPNAPDPHGEAIRRILDAEL